MSEQWTKEKAWEWYRKIGPIRGCNYVPRTAVNTTEFWQALDEETIDEELGWAESVGMNSIRVFVQYIVYEAEPKKLIKRMERLLDIADSNGLSVMYILFDDCFKPEPQFGQQPDPIPGVHNSQWTSSPGEKRKKKENWPALEKYIKDVVGYFADDSRILAWDLYNEPKSKSVPLMQAAFEWARSVNPSQPVTTCWHASDISDITTFHEYRAAENARESVEELEKHGRPMLCTECIARTLDSNFETILPLFAQHKVGWYMWGLVQGRIQTYCPWGSKDGDPLEPELWFHDLFRPDGTPYKPAEIELIRGFTFEE